MSLILNLKNLHKRHERFAGLHADAVADEAEEARKKLLKVATERPRFIPRTGKTQKANKAKVIRRKGKVVVRASNKLKHAAALDRGARPHIIRARNAPYLHFKGKNGWVRTKQVRHPGNKPYRFLYGATVAAGRSFHQSMSARMRTLARKFLVQRMTLKFLPAGDAQPLEPHAPLAVGQPARRIGRKFNYETKEYELSGKPFQCEDGTKQAWRCRKMLRRGDVVPADEATAKACGVEWAGKKGAK